MEPVRDKEKRLEYKLNYSIAHQDDLFWGLFNCGIIIDTPIEVNGRLKHNYQVAPHYNKLNLHQLTDLYVINYLENYNRKHIKIKDITSEVSAKVSISRSFKRIGLRFEKYSSNKNTYFIDADILHNYKSELLELIK